MHIFNCKNIYKYYGKENAVVKAIDGINLNIEEQDSIVLLGESGTGKTTLLNILSGVDTIDKGIIQYRGKEISNLGEDQRTKLRQKSFGYIFQFFELVSTLTVEENICLPLFIQGKKREMSYFKILVEKLGIEQLLKKYPFQLSGGQQQRVAIARALVGKPDCVFADEPTGNLDSKNKYKIMELLQELKTVYPYTLLMATHDEEVATIANRRIYLKDGKIEKDIEWRNDEE